MTNIIYPNIPISLINSFNGRVYFLERIFFFFFLTILTYIFLCTYALNAIKVIELYMEHTKKKTERVIYGKTKIILKGKEERYIFCSKVRSRGINLNLFFPHKGD
jgi:hypothetical protein